MGSYIVKHGDTPGQLAQRFLGDARRWKELWPGDAHQMPTGFTMHFPQGPPASRPVGPAAGGIGQGGGGIGPGGTAGGKPTAPSPAGTQTPTAAENSAFANLPGPERTQIQAITAEFMSFLGYPQNIDENMLMVLLMQQGLQNNPDQAFSYLFQQITPDLQKSSPWAQFGLDEATYMNTRGKLIAAWTDLTGGVMPDAVMQQAMSGHWSEQQLEQFARSDPTLAQTQPWIASGQSHLQVQEAFIASYGHAPQDDAVLAGWFRFSQSARQVSSSAQAPVKAATTGVAASTSKDTEVR